MTNNTDKFVIYHNPRCSKSREALALLQQRGIEPRIVEYLQTAPTEAELREVILRLKNEQPRSKLRGIEHPSLNSFRGKPRGIEPGRIKPQDLLRKGEDVFKKKFSGRNLSNEECITAMADYPILIERPIVIHGERAVIGRPPERVLELV